ncbi:tryptophan-rich sensory protein [Arthrobacter mangrovi]|uniref:Tryptophan-rich sensory protein n=1 Tax=Arthrobacter mangrovi TaxID=2966350 RepID=A0ABQ5MXB3_9MICC|nr:tryptophan-rich sensory protein [Arthrobacter mangrovi]GLB68598.1 hypothetical protein AHIS1636_30400 [Arthrobacter mangrovi]
MFLRALDSVTPYFQRARGVLATDDTRRAAVTLGLVLCLLAGARGAGLLGGSPVAEAAEGAYAAGSTLLAPSSQAFLIWPLIYLGLLAFTAFQWLPGQRISPWQRAVGWYAAAAMLLHAAWVAAAAAGLVGLSLLIMLALAAALAGGISALSRLPAASRAEAVFMDVPLGIYLGWILLAAGANAASWLAALGGDLFGWGPHVWGVLATGLVAFAGAVAAMTGRGRMSVAAALCWGLFWLALARVTGEPASVPVAVTAGFGFLFVLVCGGSRTFQVAHEERRAFRQGYLPGA